MFNGMVFKNYYKILELPNNVRSTQDEIKNAYRIQAKKYHPDVNVNNKVAEERFKDINEAYRILSNFTERKKYDKSWNHYVGKKMQKERASKKEVGVNDLVGILFGEGAVQSSKRNQSAPKIRGENIETRISVSIKEAFDGTEKKLSIVKEDKKNEVVSIKIPAGIKNGEIVRASGYGKPGKNGGDNGDLLVKIEIANNSIFRLEKDDIHVKLYVTPWDAALGSKLMVDSLEGQISILIPKGTQTGDRISIPNKGYIINNNKRGNLVVEADVLIPKKLTEEERALFLKLKEISKFNPSSI